MVKCNSLDLSLFQFDYDLTFAAFFMNGDHTIYARYGTRTSQDADKDVAVKGLAATMTRVLEIHARRSEYGKSLIGKQPLPVKTKIPEDFPSLGKFQPSLNYKKDVSKSCIHCHQLRDAERKTYRSAGKPLPDSLMFPYPIPQSIGLKFDPKTKSQIMEVIADSFAEKAGLKKGDSIEYVNSQLIASPADLQWVLHNDNDDGNDSELLLTVDRNGRQLETQIDLPKNWRNQMDISWRVTSWELRRMALGGMKLEALEEGERDALKIGNEKLALKVEHVGKYGQHAVAHRAGVKPGDVLIEFDGRRDLLTESRLFEYGMNQRKRGDEIKLILLRNGKEHSVRIVLQ